MGLKTFLFLRFFLWWLRKPCVRPNSEDSLHRRLKLLLKSESDHSIHFVLAEYLIVITANWKLN